jgi:L-fuconolactonase
MASRAPISATGHFTPRNDWLARHVEDVLDPDLPIVDPDHHLVERPETGRYLLPELLADSGSGHNIIATVYLEWLSMCRATGPAEMKPVAE